MTSRTRARGAWTSSVRCLRARHGRGRARDPGLGGRRRGGRRPHRRRCGRPRFARLVAAPAQERGQVGAARHRPLRVEVLPPRDLVPDAPADRPRRADDRAADLLADGARVQRDGGRDRDRSAVVVDVRRRAARREEGGRAKPEQDHPGGLRAARDGRRRADPERAASGLERRSSRPLSRSRSRMGWSTTSR